MPQLCLITHEPLSQKIAEIYFNLREGDYLERILTKSGIAKGTYAFSQWNETLENRLLTSQFQVIITLGAIPTGLLLKLPKSFKLKEYLGKTYSFQNKKLVPWYSASHLLIKGKKLEQETVKLFSTIKEIL